MLRSLPSRGTSFNIVSFGSSYSPLWPSSYPYTVESVNEASKHIDNMDANLGGTEIRSAIQAAFQSRLGFTVPAVIFLLTDGDSYDLNGVKEIVAAEVKQAKAARSLLRVFCMGIGNSSSKVRPRFNQVI